ncbi:uncharacterized protein N7459_000964 [Penicillium hispanicum]|uniref:uncharacterized protein n=1 Tax=Penicillium hispanicum TaxID=1080232 RepID=UPI0025411C9F|nr:uncharacterized protein N7459_000964 [Penicillium hispanicum]KAJ5594756.1 hypothetical protein N7459_000964 [Penicillium hispanicum]
MPATSTKADHLCVLVHGLWGNPSHLDYVASALRERHADDELYILCAKGNSGNFTYDGVELGGERLVHEIEETLETLNATGQKIKKLSVIGYSLGGLVARYAIGLLQARGLLDTLDPVNFTTFASPHVGVRTPPKGFGSNIWNGLGARTISTSGQQLFLVDSFRDTGRPLLSILADPESIFIQGLKRFRNRCAYANIVNDHTTAFYTTALSKVDPFRDLENININYLEGYEDVIVNPDEYLLPFKPDLNETWTSQKWKQCRKFANDASIRALIALLIGPVATIFLSYAVVQTIRSRQRIRLHEEGKAGVLLGRYRVPLLVQNVQHAMEEVFENVNARQEPAFLPSSETEISESPIEKNQRRNPKAKQDIGLPSYSELPADSHGAFAYDQPNLALSPEQFAIIDSLNDVGFRRYPVHIHKHSHSHAAIIVRAPKEGFSEGKIVMKHWLDNEFAI